MTSKKDILEAVPNDKLAEASPEPFDVPPEHVIMGSLTDEDGNIIAIRSVDAGELADLLDQFADPDDDLTPEKAGHEHTVQLLEEAGVTVEVA